MTPAIPLSPTAVLGTLATEYPAEVSSLLKLDHGEAVLILRQVVKENPGFDAEDAANRIAEKLRALHGLTRCETEVVTAPLTRVETDLFDALCANAAE